MAKKWPRASSLFVPPPPPVAAATEKKQKNIFLLLLLHLPWVGGSTFPFSSSQLLRLRRNAAFPLATPEGALSLSLFSILQR